MGAPCVTAMRNGKDLYRWIFSPYDGNIQSAGRMLFDHYLFCFGEKAASSSVSRMNRPACCCSSM